MEVNADIRIERGSKAVSKLKLTGLVRPEHSGEGGEVVLE